MKPVPVYMGAVVGYWLLPLKPQTFLAGEDAVYPAFFVGVRWIESGEGLSQTPEAFILADTVVYEKLFKCVTPA